MRGVAKVRGQMIELQAADVVFPAAGEASARLVASRRDAKALTSALKRRRVVLKVSAEFSDRVGNEESVRRRIKLR